MTTTRNVSDAVGDAVAKLFTNDDVRVACFQITCRVSTYSLAYLRYRCRALIVPYWAGLFILTSRDLS
jgi:hypothetical protein